MGERFDSIVVACSIAIVVLMVMVMMLQWMAMRTVSYEDMKGQVHEVSLCEYLSIWTWREDVRVVLLARFSNMMEPTSAILLWGALLFGWTTTTTAILLCWI